MIEQFPAILAVPADDHVLLIVQHHGVINGGNVAGSIRVVTGTERTIIARLLGVDEQSLVATEQFMDGTLWTRQGDVELWITGSDSTRSRCIAAVVATLPGMSWSDANAIAEHVPSRVTGGLSRDDDEVHALIRVLFGAGVSEVALRGGVPGTTFKTIEIRSESSPWTVGDAHDWTDSDDPSWIVLVHEQTATKGDQ